MDCAQSLDHEHNDSESLGLQTLYSFQQSLVKFSYQTNSHSPGRSLLISRETGHKTTEGDSIEACADDDAQLDAEGQRSPAGTPAKKRRRVATPRQYAAPEKYAHLRPINDYLEEGLDIVFCGINPGRRSAELGHHFAHSSNHFWKCLHLSGLTNKQVPPTEDHTLPERFYIGLTNMVDRPTAEANELKDSEFIAGIAPLFRKISRYRPRFVAFVGLHTSKLVLKYVMRNKANKTARIKAFKPGLQNYKLVHQGGSQQVETLFYALPCTSGKVQGYQIPDKVALFAQLKMDLCKLKDGLLSTDDMVVCPMA
ncbi:hypothetical protein Moror_1803 [Moniliophthora roreri MCA 2997]|uniref:Uracil-DNA glycosylase-like domain-containing protein n=1 Tax=Moniliophthora roreri (strain MCA 2997) TaxID=1381753 RepID=V2XI38_MONRO|nr:hypothetical protein Moror_1803 [Moniliophthora roreri MCA 2997]